MLIYKALIHYPIIAALLKPWADNSLLVFAKVSKDMFEQATSDTECSEALGFQQCLDLAYEGSLKEPSIVQDFLVTVGQKPHEEKSLGQWLL